MSRGWVITRQQPPWKRGLWIGYTLFWVVLIAYVRLIKPWRMWNALYRVEVRPERGRTWTLDALVSYVQSLRN